MIPSEMKEHQWIRKVYDILADHGISREQIGSSFHGLRHKYAQSRYLQETGFEPAVKFETKQEFLDAVEKAGKLEVWKQVDMYAKLIIKTEMGHGAERTDVVNQYLGSFNQLS